MSRVIKYDALATADLLVNAVYEREAGSRLSGEPLSKLIPGASNQGGFRASGKGLDKKFVLLFTTLEDETWPDRIDSNSGRLVYYGDNKKAKYELHKTPRGGNRILRYVSTSSTTALRYGNESTLSLYFKSSQHLSVLGLSCSRDWLSRAVQICLKPMTWYRSGELPMVSRSKTTGPRLPSWMLLKLAERG